ncbi:MAG: hypothetical protein LBR82_03990 [Desulfovibrio sp.]|jgi:hypothetical protein|nr:hypothetical protein [Desulfovibrio sp.]
MTLPQGCSCDPQSVLFSAAGNAAVAVMTADTGIFSVINRTIERSFHADTVAVMVSFALCPCYRTLFQDTRIFLRHKLLDYELFGRNQISDMRIFFFFAIFLLLPETSADGMHKTEAPVISFFNTKI